MIEADYALKYVDSDYVLDVKKDIGLTDSDLAGQYPVSYTHLGAPGLPRDDSLLYDLLRKGTQFAALGLDVLCGKDGTYQRHAVHARCV